MPVPSMQQANWQTAENTVLSNEQQEMSANAMRNAPTGGVRSQDDANVEYFYQRPQAEGPQQYNSKRWAVGDDSMIEQHVRVAELERGFQNLGFAERPQIGPHHAKKIWETDDKGAGGDQNKAMFPGQQNLWSRDDGWQTSSSGALGVNMAEYVLQGSPVGNRKRYVGPGGDVDPTKQGDKGVKGPSPFDEAKEGEMVDGQVVMVQNNIDDRTGGQPGQESPQEGEVPNQHHLVAVDADGRHLKPEDILGAQQNVLPHGGLHLDTPQFEPVGIDPFPGVDYSSMSSQLVSNMDSPNFNIDYTGQQRQQHLALLAQQQQQQFALQQQQQIGLGGFAGSPAAGAAASDPSYPSVGIPLAHSAGQQVIPQYYSVPPQWGIYPAAGLLQQQGTPQPGTPGGQPLIRGPTPRSLTPSQPNEGGLGTPTGIQPQLQTPGGTPQYQILAPAYYDSNGQLVMGNGRGMGTPVRLVSPAPILVNTGQQGTAGLTPGTFQILTNQGQQFPMPGQVPSGEAGTPQQKAPLGSDGYPPSSTPQYTTATGPSTSLFTPNSTGLSGLGAMGAPVSGYSNGALGSPGGATPGTIWSGFGAAPRLYSAAPGAEAKIRAGAIGAAATAYGAGTYGIGFGSTNLDQKLLKRVSLLKESASRSRLLEDFRNNRIPNLQLKDLTNHVVEFSQDQHGSRFIQQKLERATVSEKAMVFNEILSSAYVLMTDVFGNYVIQKFFEFGTPDQKQTLAQRVRGQVLPLALQMYGCRVIQKALESIPADMQVVIVKELDNHVLKCVKDQNGNHVVQKCIECVEPKHLQFIIDAFKGQVFTLSTHPYGCRVIQRILEHCTPEQTTPILDELHQQTERLVQDQYGNYVIQHVLEHGRLEDKNKIVAGLRGKILVLSQHKFASNVVEKCVSNSGRPDRAMLIEEVCAMNDNALYTMMKDQFANYVVQKMIDIAELPQRKMLIQRIRPHIATLRKFTYGKHILAKLEKFYSKTNVDLGPIGMPPTGLQ